jgi:hypothetical protein
VVGPSELLPGPSDPYADRPTFYAGLSGAVPGLPRGAPIMANTTGQFGCTTVQTGYTYAEPVVAHHAPNYYTPQQQYVLSSTYLNHNAPYNHRPINTIDRSRQEGRYTNARPNEPHSPGSGGLPPDAMEKIREEMTELFQDKFGVSVARVGQSYQKPYNHRFDTVPYPQGARIPEFSKFSGENGRSTHGHIGQFLAHLGELADGEAFRVRLFSLSLTSTAFAWYAALPPNSIDSWNELESKFHEHFFAGEYELGLADLASVRQVREESVNDYIRRFRDTRNRCFRIHVADKELAGLAFNGLLSYLRDKLDGTQFFSIAQLHQRALACESRFKETSKLAAHTIHLIERDSSDDKSADVYTAEFIWPTKAKSSACSSLQPVQKNRQEEIKFTFNVAKCDKIFDKLLKNGNIKLTHIIPPIDELKRRAYCK